MSTLLAAKGQLLTVAYAELAGCAPTAEALARHQASIAPSVIKTPEATPEARALWQARLDGALMRNSARQSLSEEFPAFTAICHDLLWDMLKLPPTTRAARDVNSEYPPNTGVLMETQHPRRLDSTSRANGSTYFEELSRIKSLDHRQASLVRVDDAPLDCDAQRQAAALVGVPHWTRLGYMLLLMRAGGLYAFYQLQYRLDFCPYFTTCCLSQPCRHAAVNLYHAVDELIDSNLIERPYNWPAGENEFNERIARFEKIGEVLVERGWTADREQNPDRYLMCIFHLGKRCNLDLADRLISAGATGLWLRKHYRMLDNVDRALTNASDNVRLAGVGTY